MPISQLMILPFLSLMRTELIVTGFLLLFFVLYLFQFKSNRALLSFLHIMWLLVLVTAFIRPDTGTLFADTFETNGLISFQKTFLFIFFGIILCFNADWLLQHKNLYEYIILMLAALLGICMLLSSKHFLLLYLSLELTAIPIATLCVLELRKRVAAEAGIKMIFSSAFASGILLFGISLMYGLSGSLYFDDLSVLKLNSSLHALAFILIFAAFAFKLSLVPFHLWTADVYQGSPITTTAFLSVVSKAGSVFILLAILYKVFPNFEPLWYNLIVCVSVATILIGNLFAIRQTNVKRFLAFSSIAQMGYIIAGMSAFSNEGASAVIYFVTIYGFSNLIVFGVFGFVSQQTGKEDLEDYRGFYQENKLLSWSLAIGLISLAGIPPTAGFFGKFLLMTAAASKINIYFVIFLGLNLMISLYYYMRIVRSVFELSDMPLQRVLLNLPARVGIYLCIACILLLGFIGWFYDHIQQLVMLN